MSSGYEDVLAEVESRLTAPADFMPGPYGTRRGHLTPMPRDNAPGAHIVGGDDEQRRGSTCGRDASFTVSIFTRDDAGSKAADPYVLELYARLGDPAKAWPGGVGVMPDGIHREQEVADGDAARTDCRFKVRYDTAGPWSLELAD